MKLKHIFIAQFILFAVLPYQSAFGQTPDCSGTSIIQGNDSRVDSDGDGLIEICTAQGLNNVRHRLNGTEYRTSSGATGSTNGCPLVEGVSTCRGYELGNDIDLKGEIDDWVPISSFNAIFEGNGYVIRNLTINVPASVPSSGDDDNNVGLFRSLGGISIRNVGLVDINITGGDSTYTTGNVIAATPNRRIGSFVGSSAARITNSYATGTINVRGQTIIGGLVGYAGQHTANLITNSYSAVNIQGDYWGGGLVGVNCINFINPGAPNNNRAVHQCRVGTGTRVIRNSYTIGSVSGTNVAGLVGATGGSIENAYTIGEITLITATNNARDALVAQGSSASSIGAFNSYWNHETSVPMDSPARRTGTRSLTTMQMQSPTAPDATNPTRYTGWSTDNWDFGTSNQYPALKHASLCVTTPTTVMRLALIEEPQCGTLLPYQRAGLGGLQILTENVGLDTNFEPDKTSYTVEVSTGTAMLQLQLRRYNRDAIVTVESNDGQSRTLASNENQPLISIVPGTLDIVVKDAFASTTYTLAIEYPDIVLQKGISAVSSANEGTILTLSLPVDAIGGGSGDINNHSYRWEYQPSDPSQLLNPTLELLDATSRTLAVRIPTDFIGRDYDQSDVVFTVTVSEVGSSMLSTESTVTIIKQDNSDTPPDVNLLLNSDVSGTTLTAIVNSPEEDGTSGEFQYSWQSLALDDRQWRAVKTETTARTISTYTIVEGTPPTNRYRVELVFTDAQGYTTTATQSGIYRVDVDIDDDGLVEIYYLEDLDAIRHQPDGRGYQAPSSDRGLNSMGCDEDDSGTCSGYEIARHLDFGNDLHYLNLANKTTWTTNTGWLRIDSLTAVLEGNGNTISGLYIQRDEAGQGLFRQLGGSGLIRNLGLLGVNVSSMSSNFAGGFVSNLGERNIINSYVWGTIAGNQLIGGLASGNRGTIANSYARVTIDSQGASGGLYARSLALVNNSYVRGFIGGSSRVGAIVSETSGSIEDSYAATNRDNIKGSGTARIFNSHARTGTGHDELKQPIAPGTSGSELYNGWDTDRWDFGTPEQFPILKYYSTATGIFQGACSDDPPEAATDQPQCGTFLPDQNDGLRDLEIESEGITLDKVFASETTNHVITFYDDTPTLKLRLKAYESDSQISVRIRGDDTDYFAGTRATSDVSDAISLVGIRQTTMTITVQEVFPETETQYMLTLINRTLIVAEEISTGGDAMVADDVVSTTEGRIFMLEPQVMGGTGTLRYEWTAMPENLAQLQNQNLVLSSTSAKALTVLIPPDFIRRDDTTSTVVFSVTVSDDIATTKRSIVLTIDKANNDTPLRNPIWVEDGVSLVAMEDITDLDGNPSDNDFRYEWQRKAIDADQWMDILDATSRSNTYTPPAEYPITFNYRVGIRYTDGQGYSNIAYSSPTPANYRPDIDIDDNGLIEVYYLEDLDAIRYQTDGSGYRASSMVAVKITTGCPSDQCSGYEITRHLDFSNDTHYRDISNKATWTSGEGWLPIGDIDNPFNAVFAASIDTLSISNLNITRAEEDNIGLFGVIGPQAKILDIQLRNPEIEGRYAVGGLVGLTSRLTDSEGRVTTSSLIANSSVINQSINFNITAKAWVGGLVGSNYGSIVNSHTQVGVQGRFAVGGLAGYSFGPISDSYALSARGSVPSFDIDGREAVAVGGLVGYNHNERPFTGGGSITNSYANIRVEGDFDVGGLVGYNDAGTIDNSYALGDVIGSTNVGGLVGYSSTGTIVGHAGNNVTGANNVGKLVSPESGGMVTSLTKPTLMYTADVDSNGYSSCVVANGQTDYRVKLPACNTPLPGQNIASRVGIPAVNNVTLSVGTLEPPFDPTITSYEIFDIPDITIITVSATKDDADAALYITNTNTFTEAVTSRTFVRENIGEIIVAVQRGSTSKSYIITIPTQPRLGDVRMPCNADNRDRDGNGLIEICDLEGLYEIHAHLALDAIPAICGQMNDGVCRGYELARDLDFSDNDSYRSTTNRVIWTQGRGWRPIGNPAKPFNAEFNATTANYSIANLIVNRNVSHYAGLFGYTGPNARIINVGLPGANVLGQFLAGGLVGRNQGTIINSHIGSAINTSTIIATSAWGGGLVGENAGLINNSHTFSNVMSGVLRFNTEIIDGRGREIPVGRRDGIFIGGLAATNSGQIINSISKGIVQGPAFAGGLVGINAGNIDNSYATGTVRNNSHADGMIRRNFYYAGGLVGLNVGNINNTYALGDVIGSERVGGLVGDNRNLIASSYAAVGEVTGTRLVGELVGINTGSIMDSYVGQSGQSDYDLVGEPLPVGVTENSQILSDTIFQTESSIAGWIG